MSEITFADLPLSPSTQDALRALGYTHPTPVQKEVLERASAGKDLVVQARTGSGKTAAFGIPIVDRLVRTEDNYVQVLALTPT
nr:DEAD/DEAH box helicase [Polyangiaceae bacterium]